MTELNYGTSGSALMARGGLTMPEINVNDSLKIGIGCTICGSFRELTEAEVKYNRYFGSTYSIYICDKCKAAIEWAKVQMEKQVKKDA